MDPSDVQFVAARPRKRTHASELPPRRSQAVQRSSSQSTTPGPSNAGVSQNPRPSPPRLHYPGDGLDFRRPVVSSDSSRGGGVIDLTNEPDSPPQPRRPPPPGLGRDQRVDVVDLEAEEEEEPEVTIASPDDPPSSPEVQFMGASLRPRPAPPQPPPPRSFGVSSNLLRVLGWHGSRLPAMAREDIFTQVVARRAREIARHRPPPHVDDVLWMGGDPSDGAIDLTVNLDVNPRELERRPPPARAYKPPSPAPEGFTRTVGDEDVVCCPNCDAELGVGSETKQQIWVVKQCGHVYCGECATHRSQSKAKKNPTPHKTKPFAKCLVDNCGKSVSAPRSMFQVYL